MTEHDLPGDSWVLIDGKDIILRPDGGLMSFESKYDAEAFREKHDSIAHYDAVQVKRMLK